MTIFDRLEGYWSAGLERLPEATTTLVIGLVVVEFLIFLASKLLRFTKLPPAISSILYSLLRAFMWVVLFVAVIQAMGLNNIFLALTGSSVIFALFLSTGVAPLITDVISGLFLGGEKHFQPGHRVIAGDKQTEGVIETMDARKVRIRSKDGLLHVIPNSVVERNEWVVLADKSGQSMKQRSTRRR